MPFTPRQDVPRGHKSSIYCTLADRCDRDGYTLTLKHSRTGWKLEVRDPDGELLAVAKSVAYPPLCFDRMATRAAQGLARNT